MTDPQIKRRKKIVPIVLGLAILGGILRVTVFKPKFQYAGTLEATQVDLSARVASVISLITVEEGAKVKKDDVLVTMACEDIRLAARLANENFDRAKKLYAAGTLPKEQYEKAINSQQDATTRVNWCTVSAPIPGTILTRYQEPGEWVNPGTKVIGMANVQDIWAYIYVPQPVVHLLKIGMSVRGSVPEISGKEFSGKILKINDQAEFTPKNVQTQAERTRLVFGVKIGFENSDETLKPGMTIEANLPTQ